MVLAVALAAGALGQETTLESRIVSVGMFKNGLATVKRAVTVQAAGTYLVSDVPEPVHGTFWIESDAKVEVRVTTREIEEPGRGENLHEELAGRKVLIHFRDGRIQPASGRVVTPEADGEKNWDRAYENFSRWYRSSSGRSGRGQSGTQPRYLVLETDRGRIYVEPSMIAYAQAEGEPAKVTRRRPVLVFNVTEMKEKPATILVTYLTKGIAWAPSYQIDISDQEELRVEQKAVIKNELGAIDGAELYLITGFPSVEFGHVTSPLSLRTTWTDFFRQLRTDPRSDSGRGYAMTQQSVMWNSPPSSTGAIDLSAIPEGEGPDIHYHPIGPRTLAEGDSLALSVASGKASYERIVEWIVPDTRTVWGRHIDEHEMRRNPEKYQDAAWDSIRFRNPLDFPMTTGPAMIVADGHFQGQRMSYFVNKGEQTTLHITKALSVRTRATEHEEPVPGKREIIYYGGRAFRRVPVKGELVASNHRAETVTLVIRRRFSGELLEADGNPRCVLREEGVYSVNKRNELIWTFELEPGKEKNLTYSYSVLVYH